MGDDLRARRHRHIGCRERSDARDEAPSQQPRTRHERHPSLLKLCAITTLDEAEELYEDFYPGDLLTERAIDMVTRILDAGLPPEVPSPGPIDL